MSLTDGVTAEMARHHDKQAPVSFDQGLLAAAQEAYET